MASNEEGPGALTGARAWKSIHSKQTSDTSLPNPGQPKPAPRQARIFTVRLRGDARGSIHDLRFVLKRLLRDRGLRCIDAREDVVGD